MLVTISSSTSGQIQMFAEILRRLFDIVGKECTARGVFTNEQLPEAIKTLQHAIVAEKAAGQQPPPPVRDSGPDEAQEATSVGLAQRAYPLIELMERTSKEGGYLMWLAPKEF